MFFIRNPIDKSHYLLYNILIVQTKERTTAVAYKNNTVVISVPLSNESNKKLYAISKIHKIKSKTQYAKILLEKAIEKDYKAAKTNGKTNSEQQETH